MRAVIIIWAIWLYILCVIDRIICLPFTNIEPSTLKKIQKHRHKAEQMYYRVYVFLILVGFVIFIKYLISLI